MHIKCKTNYSFMVKKFDKNNNKETYNTYIYCQHCHNMNMYVNFLNYEEDSVMPDKKIIDDIINHLWYIDNYNEFLVQLSQEKISKKSLGRYLSPKKNSKWEDMINKIKFKHRTKKEILLTCPICGKIIKNSDMMELSRSNSYITQNSFIKEFDITENEDKIILSVYIYSIFPAVEYKKLKYTTTNVRFVFNKDTRNIYAFQPICCETKKPIYKEANRILNITYLSNSANFLTYLQRIATNNKDVLINLLGYFEKYFEKDSELDKKNIRFKDLCMFFRYPMYDLRTRNNISHITNIYCSKKPSITQKRKVTLQELYLMQTDIDFMFKMLKQKKCPLKKKFLKCVYKNPTYIYLYYSLKKMGFKDYNVILEILENMKEPLIIEFLSYYVGFSPDTWTEYNSNFIKEISSLFKYCIEKKGEVYVKNSLLSFDSRESIYIYQDMISLYTQLLTYEDFNMNSFTNLDFRHLHDTFSSLITKMKFSNRKIPYKADDLKLNDNINSYNFVLAPDTYSLVDCGEKMGICVGGYGDRAVSKSSNIVFIIHNNKFVGCIELDNSMKTLKQAKAKYNNYLSGDVACAFKEWVEKYNIKAESCYDYTAIADKKDRNCSYNFCVTARFDDVDEMNKNVEVKYDYNIIN